MRGRLEAGVKPEGGFRLEGGPVAAGGRQRVPRVGHGDDPRGGVAAADAYGCYKVKCAGTADGSINVNDQFATRLVARQKLTTICTPVDLP